MVRKYPYYPAWDGKKPSTLIVKCAELCGKRWKGTKNLGTYVNRDMRGKPGQKSVHATGFALDLGYKDETQARDIWDFFVGNSLALNVAEVHWYTFGKYGAGYRCSRGEGKTGVKIYANAEESAGSGGMWLHIELVDMDPTEWETRFRALKPKDAQ